MSDRTKIQWSDASWPITTGCSEVGAECANCYARTHSWRLAHHPNSKISSAYLDVALKKDSGSLRWSGTIKCLPERLHWPLKWRQPKLVFVANMSDLFHPGVNREFIDTVFAVMTLCSQHTFQVLTKRPQRLLEYLIDPETPERIASQLQQLPILIPSKWLQQIEFSILSRQESLISGEDWPLPNLWIGTSVGTQSSASKHLPLLLQTPAYTRFLSCEPLLEPVDLSEWLQVRCIHCGQIRGITGGRFNGGEWKGNEHIHDIHTHPGIYTGLQWLIIGGESGKNARACSSDWIRSLLQQCRNSDVPVFIKQLGTHWARLSDTYALDSKGGNPDVWSEDLRVREFPQWYEFCRSHYS